MNKARVPIVRDTWAFVIPAEHFIAGFSNHTAIIRIIQPNSATQRCRICKEAGISLSIRERGIHDKNVYLIDIRKITFLKMRKNRFIMVYAAMKDTGIIRQLFHPDIYAPCKNKACIPFLSGTQAFP